MTDRFGISFASSAVAAVVVAMGGCGAGGGGERAEGPATTARAPVGAPTSSSARRVRRPGCGTYCKQAGGYGGAPTGGAMVRVVTPARVPALDPRTAAITLTCRFKATCRGALLLAFSSVNREPNAPYDVGRVDLVAASRSTTTLGVPLSAFARARLAQRGQIAVLATADTFPSLQTLPVAERSRWSALSWKRVVLTRPAASSP